MLVYGFHCIYVEILFNTRTHTHRIPFLQKQYVANVEWKVDERESDLCCWLRTNWGVSYKKQLSRKHSKIDIVMHSLRTGCPSLFKITRLKKKKSNPQKLRLDNRKVIHKQVKSKWLQQKLGSHMTYVFPEHCQRFWGEWMNLSTEATTGHRTFVSQLCPAASGFKLRRQPAPDEDTWCGRFGHRSRLRKF
jgi:hypothetical protein